MVIDHVIYLTGDLDAAAQTFRERFGFGSIPGGTHPGGTRNIVVPLQAWQYVELLGIADRDSDSGRQLLAFVEENGDQLVQWAIRVEDINRHSERVGVHPEPGSSSNADGSVSRWRTLSHPDDEGALPFFIEYEHVEERRALFDKRFDEAGHRTLPRAITRIDVGRGPNDFPVVFVGGAPGIRAAAIATSAGEIVINRRL